MDARSRLEAIYKRRVDEADLKRLRAELELQVLKQYMMISDDTEPGSSSEQLHLVKDLAVKLQEALSNTLILSPKVTQDRSKILDDATHIAKVELDQIEYHTQSVFITTLIDDVKVNMSLGSNEVDLKIAENVCVKTDAVQIQKIMKGLGILFQKYTFHVTFSIRHDVGSNMLEATFEEKDGKFILLQTAMDTTEVLLDQNLQANTVISDDASMIFVCKSLAQSMGGDLTLTDSRHMKLLCPCEITDEAQCLPLWKVTPEEPKLPIVHPSPPTSAPVAFPPPPPAPVLVAPPVPAVPTVPTVPIEPSTKVEKTIKGKTLNILLAEDDYLLRQMFARYWKREPNVTVSTAADGLEAIEYFKKQKFSIIFVDIDMPYKNGVEVAKEIRQYEKDNNMVPTPIIGVSGFTERKYAEQALSAGMNNFVLKGTGYQFKDIYKIVVDYCGDPVT